MADLVPLSGNKKPFVTADGSISYYNLNYNEAYHAKSIGAYTESLHKFVYASGILEKLKKNDVWLLDICFGLGYNLAVLLNEYEKSDNLHKLNILSLEKDSHLIELVKNTRIFWPHSAYKMLRELMQNKSSNNIELNIILDDASYAITYLNFQFDIIFFDPFSKSKNPEMWDTKVLNRLYRILKTDGSLVTYACSKNLRKRFYKSGFLAYDTKHLPTGFQKGTLFKKQPILTPK